MGKIYFNVEFRPQIESGEYSVETKDGHPVRIICWDAMPDWPICGMIKDHNPASTYAYPELFDENGKSIKGKQKDLMIVTPVPELTDFERTYLKVVHHLSPEYTIPSFVEQNHLRENCQELLIVAHRALLQGQCDLQKIVSEWKPSEEQIEQLSTAIKDYKKAGYSANVLQGLLEKLKKM